MLMGDYGSVLVLIMLVSIGLTVCYSVRLIYYLAVGVGYGYRGGAEGDGDPWMSPPIFIITGLSVIVGGVLSWFVFPCPDLVLLPWGLRLSGVGLLAAGGALGAISGGYGWAGFRGLGGYLGRMWYLPNLSGEWSSFYFILGGGRAAHVVDSGWRRIGLLRRAMVIFSLLVQWGHDNMMKLYLFTFFLWAWVVFWFV
jgi:NADH dehydrogenase subunit 5 C-terminus